MLTKLIAIIISLYIYIYINQIIILHTLNLTYMMLHVDGISTKRRKKENSNITLPGLFYALKGSSHVKCLEDYLANNEHLISFIYDYYLNQYYL